MMIFIHRATVTIGPWSQLQSLEFMARGDNCENDQIQVSRQRSSRGKQNDCKGNGKDKVRPTTSHEGSEVE